MDPLLPGQAEVEMHMLSHLPYRSWCPHCVKGRGKEMHHQRQPRDEKGLAEYHLDCCFPGDQLGFRLTILVGIERRSGMKMAQVVPTKGITRNFAARRVVELIEECGDRYVDVIVKTDQEPALRHLVQDVMLQAHQSQDDH